MKFKGFTLSEVLITIAVIGVVAAITMPPLIQNYQKQVLVNQLKKNYSIVSQALQKIMADEGINNWNDTSFFRCSTENECKEILSKYLKFTSAEYDTERFSNYKNPYTNYGYFPVLSGYKLKLNDGTILTIGSDSISIDVNGEKLPNTVFRDLFYFHCKVSL